MIHFISHVFKIETFTFKVRKLKLKENIPFKDLKNLGTKLSILLKEKINFFYKKLTFFTKKLHFFLKTNIATRIRIRNKNILFKNTKGILET